MARLAATSFTPSAGYRSLADYTSFEREAANVREQILAEQTSLRLATWKRVAVYSSGAADALLLDAVRPGWKRDYTRERFSLASLFPATHR